MPLDEGADRLRLQYPEPIPEALVRKIFSTSLELAEDQEYDYETMKIAGFPPSRLPSNVFCPDLLKYHPGLDDAFAEGPISFRKGHPVPVFAAQAIFIRKGLVLSVYSNHTAVDGAGIAQIYRAWSACIRSHMNMETLDPSLLMRNSTRPDSEHNAALDAKRLLFDNLAESARSGDCPEVRFPGVPPRITALRSSPYNTVAKIIVLSASTISNLSNSLSSLTNTRISSFTALITLLWTHIINARSSCLITKEIRDTKLCIAYDHRKNLGQDYMESFMGNCATGTLISYPLSAMVYEDSNVMNAEKLAPLSLHIVRDLSLISLDWLKDRLSLFSRTPNSYQLKMDIDVLNGPDLFVTSWMHMGADCAWRIPGTSQEYSSATRKPQSRVEGNIHILPRSRASNGDKAFEVLLCLEEAEMERVIMKLKREAWIESTIDA